MATMTLENLRLDSFVSDIV